MYSKGINTFFYFDTFVTFELFYDTYFNIEELNSMPVTPYHIGPGILIKSLLQKRFSLIVFIWTQILIDIQPLIVLITGKGSLHGFSHTYIGTTLIALFSSITGIYILRYFFPKKPLNKQLLMIAFISSFIGGYSHILLDSIMHNDFNPIYPFELNNYLYKIISLNTLHQLCIISGILGLSLFLLLSLIKKYIKVKKGEY